MRKTKEETAQTRESIINAAENLFIEKGYEGVSLEDIAAEVHLTRGAVHWHFKNKKGVLLAIRERIEMPLETLENFLADQSEEDPLEALGHTVKKALEEYQYNSRLRKLTKIILHFEYNTENEKLGKKSSEQRARKVVTEVLRIAQKRSAFQVPWTPESGALAFTGLFAGVLSEWVREDTEFELIPDAEKVLTSILDIWGAQLSELNKHSG
ncbi:TetR family transcriptional regulator [Alkalicoccus daliensis]|uniref:Transcriptional regulator, TetR family n=1 Tax=Alkalicoccus daliensis TaxID=745820 RepID=A0A1H0JBP3_9BACI|nr:TetR family transcriptional regulator [Alkalicoccus daliensis]SDO41178.1 transcriptional regulator, TetR family [Alkalicoccus daliensis]